ncbi:MAG TPA: hypothetical protein ACYCC8_01260 [Candidatus Azoamicus sp.]
MFRFDLSPGFKNGGILIKHMSSILIKCKVLDLPENIVADLSNLALNQSLYLSDLSLSKDSYSKFILSLIFSC